MTKLCPLHLKAHHSNQAPEFASCVEEQCAWFDENECAIRGLSLIADTLYDLHKENQKRNTVYEESYEEPCE